MNTAHRPVSHRRLPDWPDEGAAVADGQGRQGIVQFVGEWENPAIRRVMEIAWTVVVAVGISAATGGGPC
jgi:hypothetical protein